MQPGEGGSIDNNEENDFTSREYLNERSVYERFLDWTHESLAGFADLPGSEAVREYLEELNYVNQLWNQSASPQSHEESLLGIAYDTAIYSGSIPDYMRLHIVAMALHMTVTSDISGKHNPGSAHYLGKAVDLRTWNQSPERISEVVSILRSTGIYVRNEIHHPEGQKEWRGAHLHVQSIPPRQNADLVRWSDPPAKGSLFPWPRIDAKRSKDLLP